MSRWLRVSKLDLNGVEISNKILDIEDIATTIVSLTDTDNSKWDSMIGKPVNLARILSYFDDVSEIINLERHGDFIDLQTKYSQYRFKIHQIGSNKEKEVNEKLNPILDDARGIIKWVEETGRFQPKYMMQKVLNKCQKIRPEVEQLAKSSKADELKLGVLDSCIKTLQEYISEFDSIRNKK